MTPFKKPEWFFIPAWVILTTMAVPAAFIAYFVVIRLLMIFVGDTIYVNGVRHITEDYLLTFIFPPLIGLFAGIAQYGLLRRYLPQFGRWVPVTLAAWVVGQVLISNGFRIFNSFLQIDVFFESWSLDLAFIVFGVSVGVGQWLLLKRRLPRAGWWIGANVAGWTLLSLIVGANFMDQFGIVAVGFLPACLTAVTFVWLMNQISPAAPQGI